ncbi:MAG TPA: aminodeoxychorismate synthase component I [Opitutaceae bacterium]|jgi:para-aminobenzoate synthetase
MKTLLIDNYDSFTYNIFQYLGEINGETPCVVLNDDEIGWPELARMNFDNIVISPGPGDPSNAADFGFCRDAILESRVPILGICLGHQGIGHCFGGEVGLAPRAMHGRISTILHNGVKLFKGLPSPFQAVRYHSLAVCGALPSDLEATAWTEDRVLMGLSHRFKPIYGVQFHPESIATEHGHALLRNFRDISAAQKGRVVVGPSGRSSPPEVPAQRGATAARQLSVRYRRLGSGLNAEAVFEKCFAHAPEAFWLHSASIRPGMSRFSYMGDASGPMSATISYDSARRRLKIQRDGREEFVNEGIFEYFQRELARFCCVNPGLPFDFLGGFVGYLGYELKRECGGNGAHRSPLPDAKLIFADRFIAFDHLAGETYLVSLAGTDEMGPESWFNRMELLSAPCTAPPPLVYGNRPERVAFRPLHDRAAYLGLIAQALDEINRGETYEVCLTNQLMADVAVDSLRLYRTLQRINPAPFSAYLQFPEASVISSSPERFLRIDPGGKVETKPIKGTMRRSADPAEDRELAGILKSDEKSRSENLMIVDLLRNDLGRVCKPGTVKVPKLMDVETYATVHQLVSTIEGILAAGCSPIDCVRAAFPGGSMTGAPKIRTMEIIDRLEAAPRGVYSGAIGYFSLTGAVDLSIVIRTIVATRNQVSIGVGGAIVALSDPDNEFEETLLKAKALVRAIALSETGADDGAMVDAECAV